MAAVFQEVTMNWNGEEYSITPDMRLINRIEQEYSLSAIASRVQSGNPPLSHIAGVTTIMLRAAGAKGVSSDDVYATMFAEGHEFIMAITNAILTAAFPQMPGNAEAPSSGATAKPKRKTTKK